MSMQAHIHTHRHTHTHTEKETERESCPFMTSAFPSLGVVINIWLPEDHTESNWWSDLRQNPVLSGPKYPAAAAAKSLQSCLTLCDPIDGSPPGSPIPGILQARTLEWVVISFSNA